MSNKTTLQAKNTRLNNNNTSLSDILNTINNLPEAEDIELQEKTVSSSTSTQTVTPDNGYYGLSKVTVNAIATATQATPSISVSSTGLITASATQSAGYVASGTKSATQQLTTKAAATITPKTTDQTIASGTYLTGTQTIKGDANLVAANIRSGKSIFGVSGTLIEHTDPVLQEKTVSSSTSKQTVTPDSGYDGLSKVTVNAMTTATQATPSISVNSSGLITASATQTAGYVAAGTKSATKQLTTKSAATITPTTSNQTIASGTYLTGTQTIKGDSNLVASNIRSGKSIFGVSGTLVEGITPSGTKNITTNGTHDVTNYASANVNVPTGEDLTTELSTQTGLLNTQDLTIDDIEAALEGKAAGGGGGVTFVGAAINHTEGIAYLYVNTGFIDESAAYRVMITYWDYATSKETDRKTYIIHFVYEPNFSEMSGMDYYDFSTDDESMIGLAIANAPGAQIDSGITCNVDMIQVLPPAATNGIADYIFIEKL